MKQPIRLSDSEIEQFNRDGYLVVPDLLSETEVAAFVEYTEGANPMEEHGILAHRSDPMWGPLARHPNIAGIARQILGGVPCIVQTMYLLKDPAPADGALGGPGVSLHQDIHHLPTEPNTLMACWIAMSDTDPESGGLCVVSGSHKGGICEARKNTDAEHDSWEIEHRMRDRDGREWAQQFYSFQINGIGREETSELKVRRGSGVFFTSLTIHGSYANRSRTRARRAFAVHYVKEGSWISRCDVQDTTPVT